MTNTLVFQTKDVSLILTSRSTNLSNLDLDTPMAKQNPFLPEALTFNKRVFIDSSKDSCERQYILHRMITGAKRREGLLMIAERTQGILVNCNHCLQVHQDVDLQKLLKSGKLKQTREFHKTVLVLA